MPRSGSLGDLPRRRDVLVGIGGMAGAAAIPGVFSGSSAATDVAPREGGVFTLGTSGSIGRVSPFEENTAQNSLPVRLIYDPGILIHPETAEARPWLFEDWELEGTETESPAVVVRLRDDVTWHDGTKFTANDVVFTAEYLREQDFNALINGPPAAVSSIERLGKYEVRYELSEPIASWRENLLNNLIIPKHIWEDVDDPKTRRPTEEGGPVGTGGFEIAEFDRTAETYLKMEPREGAYPMPSDVTFIDDGAPFVEAFKMRKFDSLEATQQALRNGEVDATRNGVSYDQAQEIRSSACQLNVIDSPDDGFDTIGFNLRRVPFDDKAFRQFLNRVWDEKYFIETVHDGVDATDGDLIAPPVFDEYRPYDPGASEVEKFAMFRSEDGTLDVEAARSYLQNHPDADHEYTFEEGVTDSATAADGLELYVDGEPLIDAHTDNSGTAGQGPLELIKNYRKYSPKRSKGIDRWLENLRKIGVPIEQSEIGFSNLLSTVYTDNEFDTFNIGWTNLKPNIGYLNLIAGDVYGNPTGYSGAQTLIDRQARELDRDKRIEIVQDALMQIYEDCPYLVYRYEKKYHPLFEDWAGWVSDYGGIYNTFTWLNIRRSPEVELLVRPNSNGSPSKLNSKSKGKVPVVIPATDSFDPTESVDADTLRFGQAEVVDACGGATPTDVRAVDVTGDGQKDLFLRFPMEGTGFEKGDTTAKIAGRTTGDVPITTVTEVDVVR